MFRAGLLILIFILIAIGYSLYVQPSSESIHAEATSSGLTRMSAQEKDMPVPPNLTPASAAAILIEMDTGKIMYEKQMHKRLAPASVTKVMTMLLTIEALQSNRVRLNELVTASEYAASMIGSKMYLEAGNRYTVDEMLKAIMIESANDASVALAEHIGGTEAAFVAEMNKRATELRMKNTRFANPSGLQVGDEMNHHYSTAYDIALMSRELLKHPNVLSYTSTRFYSLMQNNGKPFHMHNSNPMLATYQGMDGLKTGFTDTALHCLVATAERDGMRLLAVVLGAPDKPTRAQEMSNLLDYGFTKYKLVRFIEKDKALGDMFFYRGQTERMSYRAPQNYSVLVKKSDNIQQFRYEVQLADVVLAPVNRVERAGVVRILKNDKLYEEYELPLDTRVARADFFDLFKGVMRKLFFVENDS